MLVLVLGFSKKALVKSQQRHSCWLFAIYHTDSLNTPYSDELLSILDHGFAGEAEAGDIGPVRNRYRCHLDIGNPEALANSHDPERIFAAEPAYFGRRRDAAGQFKCHHNLLIGLIYHTAPIWCNIRYEIAGTGHTMSRHRGVFGQCEKISDRTANVLRRSGRLV